MIQDIAPKIFYNQYQNMAADDEAYIIYACGDRAFLKEEKGVLSIPEAGELADGISFQMVYLFSIDGQRFFMPYFQANQTEEEGQNTDDKICRPQGRRPLFPDCRIC